MTSLNQKLYQDDATKDFEILCNDDVIIRAHKSVLIVSNEYFRCLLGKDFKSDNVSQFSSYQMIFVIKDIYGIHKKDDLPGDLPTVIEIMKALHYYDCIGYRFIIDSRFVNLCYTSQLRNHPKTEDLLKDLTDFGTPEIVLSIYFNDVVMNYADFGRKSLYKTIVRLLFEKNINPRDLFRSLDRLLKERQNGENEDVICDYILIRKVLYHEKMTPDIFRAFFSLNYMTAADCLTLVQIGRITPKVGLFVNMILETLKDENGPVDYKFTLTGYEFPLGAVSQVSVGEICATADIERKCRFFSIHFSKKNLLGNVVYCVNDKTGERIGALKDIVGQPYDDKKTSSYSCWIDFAD